MIEVEKKFDITHSEPLIQLSTFVGNVVQDDIIYDDNNFYLSTHNACLRQRNGLWELKLSTALGFNEHISIHDEITGYDEICAALHLSDLSKFHEVWHLVTYRKKYKFQDFNLDLDHVESQNNAFVYDLLEIELMVDDSSQCSVATQQIENLAKQYNLVPTNGKNLEYFKRYCATKILN